MKSTNLKLAVVTVLVCGALAACKPEPAAPVAEVAPPAAEPAAVEPAPAPVVPEAVVPAPATEAAPADAAPADATEEDEDSPHSGGDKVAPKT